MAVVLGVGVLLGRKKASREKESRAVRKQEKAVAVGRAAREQKSGGRSRAGGKKSRAEEGMGKKKDGSRPGKEERTIAKKGFHFVLRRTPRDRRDPTKGKRGEEEPSRTQKTTCYL